ncbi:hypothetical protein PV08_04876 [Exophiala spinifera]|uniref:Uncharacterized protein n=1 Tax=Exophiala spinifera TaxID=91928 RepID=A0A0D1YR13_9EURO|nr:uncharacterized protein PV08_04876 [Exophiala spinifera]KIW17681.1 hypothetical protein PV08_04876 [Exophiala spinifera]
MRKCDLWSAINIIDSRRLKSKTIKSASQVNDAVKVRGRGCVISFSRSPLARLKALLETHRIASFMTVNDVLKALLWHSMVTARVPSLQRDPPITSAKLPTPINIRIKLQKPLPDSNFRAAIDFALVYMPLSHLKDMRSPSLGQTALEIRRAINNIDEQYIHQAVALARTTIDFRDQASNMDRANGADVYVTGWQS